MYFQVISKELKNIFNLSIIQGKCSANFVAMGCAQCGEMDA
jgi:hypothetical protein